MKILFRIESKSFSFWDPVRVRLDGAHNFAALTEWHESLDVAKEYAKRKQVEDAERYKLPHKRSAFRVTDHLGYVHWQDPAPHPELLPPAEPGRCKFCKSTDRVECVAIVYKLQGGHEIVCPCSCHSEVKQ